MPPVELPHVTIDLSEGQEKAYPAIIATCKAGLRGWDVLADNQLALSPITGGISNLLVKVTPPASGGLKPVAFKVFGDKTELLIDRDFERGILIDLNGAGFGPEVLVLFGNGRIEEFWTCYTLKPEDMCSTTYVPNVARQLRLFHKCRLNIPKHPTLFLVITGWFDMARRLTFDHAPEKAAKYSALDFDKMKHEIECMQALCVSTNSPVVFSHNDLLSGNILILQKEGFNKDAVDSTGPMKFIDFEYSAYGYRGYDIANHFNEYAGFECEYSRYPTTEQARFFLSHYFSEHEVSQDPELLDRTVAEVNLFALTSHIYWAVWSLLQARYSPIEFDYLSYSAMRWDEYYRRKDEFIAAAQAAFGDQLAPHHH